MEVMPSQCGKTNNKLDHHNFVEEKRQKIQAKWTKTGDGR